DRTVTGVQTCALPICEFTGRNILFESMTVEETAQQFGKSTAEIQVGLAEAEKLLLDMRSKRVRPHLDDKILTAWNGLMISAFARSEERRVGERGGMWK